MHKIKYILLILLLGANVVFAKPEYVEVRDGNGVSHFCNRSGCISSDEHTNIQWAYQEALKRSIGQDIKIEYRDRNGNLVDKEGYRIDENGNRIDTWKDWLDFNRAIDKVRDKTVNTITKGKNKVADKMANRKDKKNIKDEKKRTKEIKENINLEKENIDL